MPTLSDLYDYLTKNRNKGATFINSVNFSTKNQSIEPLKIQMIMKGKESKKESKKAKADGATAKVQSDYQKDKTRKTTLEPSVFKSKK